MKTLSSEHRLKISLSLKGKPKTAEHREHISQGKKGKPVPALLGHPNWLLRHTDETKKKISEALKGHLGIKWSTEAKVNFSTKLKGRRHTGEALDKIRTHAASLRGKPRVLLEAAREKMVENGRHSKGRKYSPEAVARRRESILKKRDSISQKLKQKWQEPEFRSHLCECRRQAMAMPNSKVRQAILSPSARIRARQALLLAWADPEKKTRRLQRIFSKATRRPNTMELQLSALLAELGLPYQYTGGGGTVIANHVPDFVRTAPPRRVIELFGEFWHSTQDEDKLQHDYSIVGYQLLVIWGKELRHLPILARKIANFEQAVGPVAQANWKQTLATKVSLPEVFTLG